MEILENIKTKFAEVEIQKNEDCDSIIVEKDCFLEFASFLKTSGFELLLDITCVDYLTYKPRLKPQRYEMIYHFYSFSDKKRLRVKVLVSQDNPSIDSLCGLWLCANWYEREIYDMFGIHFLNHPDLRRILMYEGFIGHPLKKDYPLKKRQPIIPHED